MLWRFIKGLLRYLHKTIRGPPNLPQEKVIVALPQLPYDPMEPLEIAARERQLRNWGIEHSYKI